MISTDPFKFSKSNCTKLVFIVIAAFCISPWLSPPLALAIGIVFAQIGKNPFEKYNHKAIQWLLKLAVIGLGFGMSVTSALSAGKEGVYLSIASISLTLLLGLSLGKFFKIDKKIVQLISSGTAICGGSAIAAISPIIRAKPKQISVAVGVVFLLNSVALFIFPEIGHFLGLSQHQFGLWSAIAIHDTSSVVGAAQVYGNEALEIATTVKLARALWILPVSLLFAVFSGGSLKKVKIPYFIGIFILAIIVNTYLPAIHSVAPYIVSVSKSSLTLVLFLIGTTLSFSSMKKVGYKPLVLAIGVWVFISVLSLLIIVKTTH
ncbi:YeiH family protein [Zunongwangia sp. H14]|uniref:YeiH family protein n=1 Tax=Zunongwangia sp. H14 TaxID=3240792 RepID=UPI003569CF0E